MVGVLRDCVSSIEWQMVLLHQIVSQHSSARTHAHNSFPTDRIQMEHESVARKICQSSLEFFFRLVNYKGIRNVYDFCWFACDITQPTLPLPWPDPLYSYVVLWFSIGIHFSGDYKVRLGCVRTYRVPALISKICHALFSISDQRAAEMNYEFLIFFFPALLREIVRTQAICHMHITTLSSVDCTQRVYCSGIWTERDCDCFHFMIFMISFLDRFLSFTKNSHKIHLSHKRIFLLPGTSVMVTRFSE